MARLTTSGAASGAAAFPKRSFARLPGTVGPELGKRFALAEEAIATKTAAQTRTLGLRQRTGDFGACPMPLDRCLQRKNAANRILPNLLRLLLRLVAAG